MMCPEESVGCVRTAVLTDVRCFWCILLAFPAAVPPAVVVLRWQDTLGTLVNQEYVWSDHWQKNVIHTEELNFLMITIVSRGIMYVFLFLIFIFYFVRPYPSSFQKNYFQLLMLVQHLVHMIFMKYQN